MCAGAGHISGSRLWLEIHRQRVEVVSFRNLFWPLPHIHSRSPNLKKISSTTDLGPP